MWHHFFVALRLANLCYINLINNNNNNNVCALSSQVVPLLGRFSDVLQLLPNSGNKFDAVLFDVGMSSMQADTAERGFSVSREGPLDMRLDGDRYFIVLMTQCLFAIMLCNICVTCTLTFNTVGSLGNRKVSWPVTNTATTIPRGFLLGLIYF